MGVKGLWELLAPVGRRVSGQTLAAKKLAIDTSIWMVQFMKAMRDEKGEMIRNAHLIGFFRRICKLLFLRTKPIFGLRRRHPGSQATNCHCSSEAAGKRSGQSSKDCQEIASQPSRENGTNLLLLLVITNDAQLKTLKLKELANDIKNQRLKQNSDAKCQKKSDQVDSVGSDLGRNNLKELDKVSRAKFAAEEDKNVSQSMVSTSYNQEELDAMLAASMVAEEDGLLASKVGHLLQLIFLKRKVMQM